MAWALWVPGALAVVLFDANRGQTTIASVTVWRLFRHRAKDMQLLQVMVKI